MCVDLRGGQGGVPQEVLHAAQVGAALHQVGGGAVAQRMGTDVPGDPGSGGVTIQQRAHGAVAEPAPTDAEEQRLSGSAVPLLGEHRASLLLPACDRVQGRRTDRDDPLLGALAGDPDRALPAVDPRSVQRHQLRDPQAGGVQQFQHRQVAQGDGPLQRVAPRLLIDRMVRAGIAPGRPLGVDRRQPRCSLLGREHRGQVPAPPGGAQAPAHVVGQLPGGGQPTGEGPCRCGRAGERRSGGPGLGARAEPGAERGHVQLGDLDPFALAQMLEQSRGLSCVGAHGVLGPATLETQVVDERLEDRLVVVAGPGTATCGHATSVSHGRGPLQLMGRAGHVGLCPQP